MKNLKKVVIDDVPEISVAQKASEEKRQLIVMQDFGRFKKGQIVLETAVIDEIMASPQKRFTRIKGK